VDAAVLRYRVMAYITGAVLIVLCGAGIPLQLAAHNDVIVNYVGDLHGFLYIVYLIMAYILARKLHLAVGPTILLLLAGTIPVLTFVVERWMMRSYINPARQAQASAPVAAPAARTP
jgi:integral membrane protein